MKRIAIGILTVLVSILGAVGPASAGLVALYRFESDIEDASVNDLDGV